ncbi:hypothetical protein [Neisseria meningitidis]|uniref:hypothetical protein n=1 Tax=Neisseria meningitidis TaxID=487 RepID=UPI0038BC3BD4
MAEEGQGKGLLEQHLTQEDKTLFLTDYKRSDGSGDKGWVVKLEAGQRVTVKPTVVLRTAFVTIRKYNDGGCGAETAILGINTADGGKLTKKARARLCRKPIRLSRNIPVISKPPKANPSL